MNAIGRMLHRMRWALHYDGWAFTIFRVALKCFGLVGIKGTSSQWFKRMVERNFDRRFGIQTAGTLPPSTLGLPKDRELHAVEYSPTWPARFGSLVSNLPIPIHDFVLIDLGSGKGRVLCMAAEFPFKKIIGIELSRDLCRLAEKNIKTFRCRSVRCPSVHVVCRDAMTYEFPRDPLILYLYNPFSETILSRVVHNLEKSWQHNRRPIVVAYFNPERKEVFDASTWLQRWHPNGWNDPEVIIFKTN